MPAYPIPPWMNQPSPTEEYAKGVQLGVGIAHQKQQLAQQAEHAAMLAEVRQKELEQEGIRQQQTLLMQKAYHDAQIGLRKQQLDQADQIVKMRTQQAAAKAAAQMSFQRRVTAGEDPAKVLLELGPAMGESLTGAAQLYKQTRPSLDFTPRELTTPGGTKLFESAPNRFSQVRIPPASKTMPEVDGGFEAKPIFYPGTRTPIRDVVAVPTQGGGYTTRNIPDREMRIAAANLARMEKGPMGYLLQAGKEPKDPEAKARYLKLKPLYDHFQQVVATGGTPETPGPAKTSGKIYTDSKGKRWRYTGMNERPLTDRDASHWVEEDAQTDEDEEDIFGSGGGVE